MPRIGLFVNGEKTETEDRSSLADLLQHLSLPGKRIAVELNGRVVRRVEWPNVTLGEGDKIEVVHFVGGG